MADARTWLGWVGRLRRHHVTTQAVVLLPVVALAGVAAWSMLSAPTIAKGQTASQPPGQTVGVPFRSEAQSSPAATPARETALLAEPAAAQQVPSVEPAAVKGLKISSQSWRRGGLGANALITFTLRNDNAYAVKDIEIACAFSRQDGSHLTDRKRIVPDATVDMKSRKTFARVHIGFVNVYANRVKCVPIAASRV